METNDIPPAATTFEPHSQLTNNHDNTSTAKKKALLNHPTVPTPDNVENNDNS